MNNKQARIEFHVNYSGDWYDGRTWHDGVPYLEGYTTTTVDGEDKLTEYNRSEFNDVLCQTTGDVAELLGFDQDEIVGQVDEMDMTMSELIYNAIEQHVDNLGRMMSVSLYMYYVKSVSFDITPDNQIVNIVLEEMNEAEIEEFESYAPDEEREDDEA